MELNAKKPGSEQPLRYRVTVPLKDADVINWMAEQSSPSFSMRMLIRAFIAKYGITDVTCLPVSAGLDLDMGAAEIRPEAPASSNSGKKTSVSLTEVRQGQVCVPAPVPAQQPVPSALVVPTSQPPVTRPAPPPVSTPAAPVGNPPGRAPVDIHDLM